MSDSDSYPGLIESEEVLDELLSRPCSETADAMARIDGDIIILGVTGKIGPSLARMISRGCEKAGIRKRITGVARFNSPGQKDALIKSGIETISGDLLDDRFVKSLPVAKNVFFLAGMKFGSAGNLPLTWAVNSMMPATVASHFSDSRIIAFSTGCVYPLVSIGSGGSKESDRPEPVGEYAQSCLGRERMFEYGSMINGTKVALIRLNYSVEMRYGVLADIGLKVLNRQPVDLAMGYFNVIWQGDVNRFTIRLLEHAESPARIINLTGPEILSVRSVAEEFGRLFGITPVFTGSEAETALLSNSGEAFRLFGIPSVPAARVIGWTAGWLKDGGKLLGKPTHYEVRDGNF